MAIKRPNPLDAVLLTGAQSVAGVKTFGDIPVLPASDPTAANEATRKSFVDGKAADYVQLTSAQSVGGIKTFTSIPVLPASDPTAANEATRKSFVDGKAADYVQLTSAQSVGGIKTFTSIPVLPASDPTAANEATRKSYVDSIKGGQGGYTAIIYKVGSMYKAEDEYGTLIIENTNAATVVQKAIDDYGEEGFILVKPPITLTTTLKLTKWRTYIEFLGKITSTGVNAIELGDATHELSLSTLKFVEISGVNSSAHGIVVTNASRSRIFFSVIQLCDIGIYFNPSVDCVATDLQIEGAVMANFNTAGVRFASVARTMEGNHFKTGIYDAPIGFDLQSGGNSKFQTFVGTIDCATTPDSEDIKDLVGSQLFLIDFARRETCTIHKNTTLINAWGSINEHPTIETYNGTAEMANIGFLPHLIWDFDRNSTSDWNKTNCTMGTPDKSVTRLTAITTGAHINRTISVDGGQASWILIRYKYISGTSGYGSLMYMTGGHGYSSSYKRTFHRYIMDGEWHSVAIDMSELTVGGTDWIDNVITGWRYDFAVDSANLVLDIDYIAIGGRGYGSMYHMDDALKTPASASAVGNKGDIRWDASYIYICTATGTWKRVAISTW